jgi:hypothetical protein
MASEGVSWLTPSPPGQAGYDWIDRRAALDTSYNG